MINDYAISDIQCMFELLLHPMTRLFNLCIDKFEVFSHFLTMAEVDFWGIPAWNKQTRKMDTTLRKRDWSEMQHCSSSYCWSFDNWLLKLGCQLLPSFLPKLTAYNFCYCYILGITGLSRKERRKYEDQKAQALGGKVGIHLNNLLSSSAKSVLLFFYNI